MRLLLLTTVFLTSCSLLRAQTTIELYDANIPNARPATKKESRTFEGIVDTIVRNVSAPTLTIFNPTGKASNTAILIVPGGGYHALLISREGYRLAKAFAEKGIAAFVLKYRLPDDEIMVDKPFGPLQDIQQAILKIRQTRKNIRQLGVMGFSAGGHLAACAGVHFDTALVPVNNPALLRPDFMMLVNPVISFADSIGHLGSRNNLLGENPSLSNIHFFSTELNVTAKTPPTLLIHTDDDTVVPVENSILFYSQLRQNKIPASIHIYAKGEHGFLQRPALSEWFDRCMYWMEEMALITP